MVEVRQRSAPTNTGNFPSGTPAWLCRVLVARGVTALDQLRHETSLLHSAQSLFGLKQALDILVEALEQGQKILIVGDYDADGATSCALAVRALGAMGAASVQFLVPDRFTQGYGLSPAVAESAAAFHPQLLITVDNGVASVSGVQRARELGMRVIVTDHHLPGSELPCADAILNPNLPNCAFPSKALAGVGVIFYLLAALRTRLAASGWFESRQIVPPNLSQWLDIVALGTVADLVPLDQNNRILVHAGLRRIRSGAGNPGIQALFEAANRDTAHATTADLGFSIGPRINAAGRLQDISIGVRCLLADDIAEARRLAAELDQINTDRQIIESQMRAEAERVVDQMQLGSDLPWGLCLHRSDWHEGIIGLIASRIKDRAHRPVLVLTDDGQGSLKGSGRSIEGLHLRDTLEAIATRHPGLIRQFGGHAMAAGLSLDISGLETLTTAFDDEVRRRIDAHQLNRILLSDGELDATDLHLSTAIRLQELAPWGQGFPEPLFEGEFEISTRRVLKEIHLKLTLVPTADRQQSCDAIWFRAPTEALALEEGGRHRFLYRLDVNRYRGAESLQLQLQALLR